MLFVPIDNQTLTLNETASITLLPEDFSENTVTVGVILPEESKGLFRVTHGKANLFTVIESTPNTTQHIGEWKVMIDVRDLSKKSTYIYYVIVLKPNKTEEVVEKVIDEYVTANIRSLDINGVLTFEFSE